LLVTTPTNAVMLFNSFVGENTNKGGDAFTRLTWRKCG
jgi:hypothetical protein